MWQPRICWSLRIHRTDIRRPCGVESRDTSARVVPKRKSPSTQTMSGEFAAEKAPSGQSTKLGNVARKAVLFRLWAGIYSCAAATGKVTTIAATRIAATALLRAGRDPRDDAWRVRPFARVVLDQRGTKTPGSLGQMSGHFPRWRVA
jgi:hypothetical protein